MVIHSSHSSSGCECRTSCYGKASTTSAAAMDRKEHMHRITANCLEHPKSASFAEPCLQRSLGKVIRIFAHLMSPICAQCQMCEGFPRRIVASHGEGFPFDEDSILQIRYPTRIHCIRMNEQRKKFKYMIKKAFPIVSSKGDRS